MPDPKEEKGGDLMPSGNQDEDRDINAGASPLVVGIILKTTIAEWGKIERFIANESTAKIIHVQRSSGMLWVVPVR